MRKPYIIGAIAHWMIYKYIAYILDIVSILYLFVLLLLPLLLMALTSVKYAIKSNHAQNFMNIHDIKSSWIINEDFRLAIAHWKSTWQAHTYKQTNTQHTHTHLQIEGERETEVEREGESKGHAPPSLEQSCSIMNFDNVCLQKVQNRRKTREDAVGKCVE